MVAIATLGPETKHPGQLCDVLMLHVSFFVMPFVKISCIQIHPICYMESSTQASLTIVIKLGSDLNILFTCTNTCNIVDNSIL